MPGSEDAPAARRLFFALWPDTALRATAAERVAALVPPGGGRPQRPEELHITLVFLGQVGEPRLASVQTVASGVTGAPLTVTLDRVEHWRKPQVLCLTASDVPARLNSLVDEFRAALAVAELPTETRPYRPHLTLARKVTRFHGRPEVEPLLWRADAITLVESRSDRQGAHYVPIAHWPLVNEAG